MELRKPAQDHGIAISRTLVHSFASPRSSSCQRVQTPADEASFSTARALHAHVTLFATLRSIVDFLRYLRLDVEILRKEWAVGWYMFGFVRGVIVQLPKEALHGVRNVGMEGRGALVLGFVEACSGSQWEVAVGDVHVWIFALGALGAWAGEGRGSIRLWTLCVVMSCRVIVVYWLFTDHGLGEVVFASAIGMSSDFDTAAVFWVEVWRTGC